MQTNFTLNDTKDKTANAHLLFSINSRITKYA